MIIGKTLNSGYMEKDILNKAWGRVPAISTLPRPPIPLLRHAPTTVAQFQYHILGT